MAPTVVTALVGLALVVSRLTRGSPVPTTARFAVLVDTTDSVSSLALSPDGTQLAYAVDRQLSVRSIDSLVAQALPDTTGGRFPFWSPDGRSIGFFTLDELDAMTAADDYRNPVLAAGEDRVAVERDGDIWVFNLERGTNQKFTFAPGADIFPIWSPGADRIVFSGGV